MLIGGLTHWPYTDDGLWNSWAGKQSASLPWRGLSPFGYCLVLKTSWLFPDIQRRERVLVSLSAGPVIPVLMKPWDPDKSHKGLSSCLGLRDTIWQVFLPFTYCRCSENILWSTERRDLWTFLWPQTTGCIWKWTNQLLFVFVKMPFQEYERKICEEGPRLDHGEEGEEEETRTVCTWLCCKLSNRTINRFNNWCWNMLWAVYCNDPLSLFCVCWPAGTFEPTLNTLDVREGLISRSDSRSCAFVNSHLCSRLWSVWTLYNPSERDAKVKCSYGQSGCIWSSGGQFVSHALRVHVGWSYVNIPELPTDDTEQWRWVSTDGLNNVTENRTSRCIVLSAVS